MSARPTNLRTDILTELTEFGVASPEDQAKSSGFSFTRFFRRNKPADVDSSNELSPRSNSITDNTEPLVEQSYESCETKEKETNGNTINEHLDESMRDSQITYNNRDPAGTRSLTNVLKRISNILDRRSSTPQAYKDSDFKQYWMPDSNCKECYECGDKFNTFRRRHHCRVCGQIFCRRCCNQEIPGKIMGYTENLRACTYCCKVVLSYIQSTDLIPSGDLKAFQDDLDNCLNDMDSSQLESSNSIYESANHNSIHSSGSFRRKVSPGFREEEFVRTSSRTDIRRFPSVPDMQSLSERKLLTKDSSQLQELWAEMENQKMGLEFQSHRHLLQTFENCVVGSEVVNWLLSNDKVSSRYQAVAIGQALIDAGILEAIGCIENVFVDKFVMYKSCKNESNEHKKQVVEYCDACQEPSWVKEIIPNEEISEEDIDNSQEILDLQQTNSFKEENELGSIPRCYSTFYLDLNVKNSTASVKRAVPSQNLYFTSEKPKKAHLPIASSDCFNSENFQSILPQSDASNTTINDDFLKDALFVNRKGTRTSDVYTAPQGWNNIHNLREENGELLAYERLHGAFEMHRQALIKQLLSNEGISLFWCDTILTVVQKVTDTVKPDIINDNDDKDIRSYVHIKTVPGGSKSESQIVGGVVSTKNVLHRKMKTYFENPHILLVSSSIVYQRIENKLSSLEPIIMQECEYLKNVVAKISSYKPDIIMVEKTISRCAQDMLLGQGITVIVNVKRSVIERIARCTQADIVSSLDAQLGTPHLGVCHRFWLRNYMMPSGRMKTLMGFDGCPKHLGCTILLRGASHAELSKVKQITQFLVYVNYNWKLECSFLMDEFALPPPLPDAMPLILYDSNQTTQRKGLFKDESMIDMHDEDLFCQKSNFSSEKIIGDELSFENEENIDKKSDEIKGFLKASKQDSTIVPKIETAKLSELHSLEEHIDPLRSECVTDTKPKSRKRSTMVVAPLPLANKFRKALNDVVLSCSPNLKYSVPYLESESGGICELRQFFGEELYWSAQFYKESVLNQNKQQMEPVKAFPHGSTTYINGKVPDNVEIQRYHPFIFTNLTNSVGNPSVSDLLANFRACGGQIKRLCPHEVANKKREKKIKMEESASLKFQSSMPMQNSSLYWERKVDALDTYKHQRLPVLFCSYSYVSNNAPNFCVSPWVVNMDFYGRNDITLGEFLERYCFRSSYECPSETCDTPMTEHIRKFVHENGSIHIVLKKLEKSFQMAESVIVMWSWCFKCKQSTPFAPMSIDTWSLSFAKYLDLRFHGISYGRRAKSCTCTHSLHHDYFQYFAYKDMVASFKYSMITLLEVCLPSIVTNIQDYIAEPAIIDEVKDLTIKGYSVYSRVLEKLCLLRERCTGSSHEVKIQQMLMTLSDERSVLRGKIGEIQVKLTSPSLEDKSMLTTYSCADSADVWCDIYDLTCYLKQMIVEAVYNWNNRIQDFINTKRKEDKAIRRQALMSLSSQGSLNSVESSTPVPSPDVLNVLVSSSHSSPLNISNETESDSVEKLSFKLKDVVPEHENTVSRHEQEYGDEQSEVLKVSQSDDDELDCSLSKSNLSNSKESVAKNSLDIEIIPEINQQSESSKIYPNINDFGGTITDENRISNSSEDNNDNLVVNPDSNKPRLQRKIGIIEDQNFFANDSSDKLYDYYVNSADKTCDTNEETVLINSDDDSEKMSQDDELFSNVRNADQPDLPKVDITMVEDNNCSDTNTELTELTETSEECRKAIEALDKLQEEEMRRRFPSVDATTFTSSNSSISSVTVCESAGICISNIDNEHPLNDSFTIVHRSQVRKLDDFTKEKEASKRGTRHGRSKSDGDKSVSSQLTSSSNSDVDSESLKLPQSSTSPVIKVPISQAVDKEKKVSGTMKNIFSQFLTSPLSLPVENPFPLTEHFLLKDPGNEENQTNKSIPIIVYDEEPSSVIAYTLSSQEYEQSLQELVFNLVLSQQKDAANSSPKSRRRNNSKDNSLNEEVPFPHSEISQSESNFSSGPKKTSVLNFVRNQSERIKVSTATNGDLSESGHHHHHMKRDSSDFDEVDNGTEINCSAEMDKNKSKIPNHHIEIQFCDSSANFYCKVYFAEQFRALRKLIFPIGEDRYIRSLARCRQWKAHGGKSGSIFCKTHDDRFILKQMSKLEVQSFAVFAAHYFKYIHQAANEQKPTVLAKIFGVYHIVYKNAQTNTQSKLHLLVMENLFYGREIKRKFDLKGSERNRLVNTAGKEESDLVLLDENLLKMTREYPLYIRPHTKTVLTMAIHNDSEFLSSQFVMDYSLLVGLDESKKELVVGIIDYIRTFTWDKKLEMVVKVIGNQGKMPTVVSPDLYRTRFCDAMDRYFFMVPDRWSGLGKGVDS